MARQGAGTNLFHTKAEPTCAVTITPPAVLGRQLADARRRSERFSAAWPVALEIALESEPDRRERQEWQKVFATDVDLWRNCFNRRAASQSEMALHGLRELSQGHLRVT